jgi:hypothetical protein
MAATLQGKDDTADLWPQRLNMPPSWVVWSIFLAIRFRLAEVGVPPGSATLEKLAALAPGTTDNLLRWATDAAKAMGRSKRGNARATRGTE